MAKQRGGVLIRLWGQSRDGTGGANCLSTVGPCCFLPLPLESTVLCFSVMAQPLMWGGLLPVCVCVDVALCIFPGEGATAPPLPLSVCSLVVGQRRL